MGISVYQFDGTSSIFHTGKSWMVIQPCAIRFISLIGIHHVNFFKASLKQRLYFILAGASLVCALYLLAATLFGTLASIAITAVISSLIWYLLNEFSLRRFVFMDIQEVAR